MLDLVHYTSRSALLEILENDAFWYIHNDRLVLDQLLPDEDLSGREPERFGAVSFTSGAIHNAGPVREDFGPFGIGVSDAWAVRVGAQPVIYVPPNGPVLQALRRLFESGAAGLRVQLAKERGDPFAELNQSVPNKRIIGLLGEGALWSTLMTLFEHMGPAENARQQEWRAVQPEPFHFSGDAKVDHLEEAARDAETWRGRQLEFKPSDIEYLVCPDAEALRLKESLPRRYRDLFVKTYR